MIGGFIIRGTETKRVVLRGVGPSLQAFGIQDSVPNPMLRLFGADGSQIAENDNWADAQAADIQATGLAPNHPLESAMVANLSPGSYTAAVTDKGGATGVGLVEVYDVSQANVARLANISTRGVVKTGENVMIGGFILGGTSSNPAQVVVRAIGPSLSQFGVPGALADPQLTLVNSNGVGIGYNDNWQDSVQQADRLRALQLEPNTPAESAIVATLPPGQYTAVVAGKSNTTGIGLIEVYYVQ
jgi:hypothetical protein